MDTILHFFFVHAPIAHYIAFGILILAGFNLPLSEDFLIVICGILASTVVPENLYKLFIAIFLGCYSADSICYWIGRFVGRKLWNFKWVQKTVPQKHFDKVELYYQRYGFFTLLFGRCIPFGVRNCILLTAGMSKMHYGKFLAADSIACFLSNITLFSIAYHVGKNYQTIFQWLKTFHLLIFAIFIVVAIALFIQYKKRKAK